MMTMKVRPVEQSVKVNTLNILFDKIWIWKL